MDTPSWVFSHKNAERSEAVLESLRASFAKQHFAVLRDFLSRQGRAFLYDEMDRMERRAIRRDVYVDESASWRRMKTLGSMDLEILSPIVSSMYFDPSLMRFLSTLANEQVFVVPDENERFVLNCLAQDGDFHGCHVDTYEYSLTILIVAPPREFGGVAIIKHGAASGIPERKIELKEGDAYFMRSDLVVHGVTPIKGEGTRRIALNFAYRSDGNRKPRSYSTSVLYSSGHVAPD